MGVNKIIIKVDGATVQEMNFRSTITGLSAGNHVIEVQAFDGATLVDSQVRNVTVPSSGSIPTTGVLANWDFDETTGLAIDDVKALNGTVFGSMVRNGTSYGFNGANTYVQVADHPDLSFVDYLGSAGDLPFTIRMLLKITAYPGTNKYAFIISKRGAGGGREYQLNLTQSSGLLAFNLGNDTGTGITFSFPYTDLPLNTLHHVVMRYDGSKSSSGLDISVNKVAKTNTAAASTYTGMVGGPEPLIMGQWSQNHFFTGEMSKIRIHRDYRWTDQEIIDDYNAVMN